MAHQFLKVARDVTTDISIDIGIDRCSLVF